MERIVRGRSATLTHTFYSSTTATDPSPDTATVTITRADGTVLVNAATATEAGTGKVTYTVTPTQTALLDRWTVDWVATFGGQSQTFRTFVEVAGDVLFTLSQARALTPLNNTTTYPDNTLIEMRTTVEQAIEDEYGTALVPRYRLETFSGDGTSMLRLRDPVRTIRTATVSGTALTAGDITSLTTNYGFLTGYTWTAGVGNITVGYEYGLDAPPQRLTMDAVRLARSWLVSAPTDDRTATFTSAEGGTYALVVPGRNGSVFGLPDLDAAIMASPYRLGVA